jgi:hypothetical protein
MPIDLSAPRTANTLTLLSFTDFATAVPALLLLLRNTEDVFPVEGLQGEKYLLMFTEGCLKWFTSF